MDKGAITTYKRTRFIDVARAIAILSIIAGHTNNLAVGKFVFTYNVPIFFLITGYFLNENISTPRFIKRKLQTLIIPYLVTGLVIVLFELIKALAEKKSVLVYGLNWLYAVAYGSGNNWSYPFFIKGIGALWFLWASFFAAVIMKLLAKASPVIRILSVILAFAVGFLSSHLLFWFPLSIQPGLCMVLFVYLGYLFKKEKGRLKAINKKLKVVCLIVSFAVWIWFILTFDNFWILVCEFGKSPLDIIASLCACLSVFAISFGIDKYAGRFAGILSYIGENSIFIYCVHAVELIAIPWDKILTAVLPSSNSALTFKVRFLLECIIAVGTGCLLSRIGFMRKIFGLKNR